jgi:ferrous iron transport protein A
MTAFLQIRTSNFGNFGRLRPGVQAGGSLFDNRSQHRYANVMRLDELPLRRTAQIAAIDWAALEPAEAKRLRELGFDEGVAVEALHSGSFFGRDPIALRVGRMTVAIRRAQARAVTVTPAA